MKTEKKTPEEKGKGKLDEKVFDVTPPGEAMPPSSGRPIIVTHKPGVSDPMVSPKNKELEENNKQEEETTPSAGEGQEMVIAKPKKARIEPLNTNIVPESPAKTAPDPEAEEKQEVSTDDPTDVATETADTSSVVDDDTAHDIADVANEIAAKKEAQSEAAKREAERAKRQEEIEALINSKEFFVPINSVQKRRSMKLILAVTVVFLVVIGFLLVLDLELIDIGIDPPTDFL